MKMIDVVIAVLALASMVWFGLILVFYVKDLALSVVIIVGLAMLAFDFWKQLTSGRRKT